MTSRFLAAFVLAALAVAGCKKNNEAAAASDAAAAAADAARVGRFARSR